MADLYEGIRDATLRNLATRPGVDVEYATGFFERNEAVLRTMVRQALAAYRPRVVAELDPRKHRICASCGHVAHEDELGPHLGMPSIGLRCPIAFGWNQIRPDDRLDQSIWTRFVQDATASYGTCGACRGFFRLRPSREAGLVLIAHNRAPRRELEAEKRKRKNVSCEGGGSRPA